MPVVKSSWRHCWRLAKPFKASAQVPVRKQLRNNLEFAIWLNQLRCGNWIKSQPKSQPFGIKLRPFQPQWVRLCTSIPKSSRDQKPDLCSAVKTTQKEPLSQSVWIKITSCIRTSRDRTGANPPSFSAMMQCFGATTKRVLLMYRYFHGGSKSGRIDWLTFVVTAKISYPKQLTLQWTSTLSKFNTWSTHI